MKRWDIKPILSVVFFILTFSLMTFLILTNDTQREETVFFTRIGMDEAKAHLEADDDIILVDVRTADEFSLMRIPNSISIPLDELEESIAIIIPNKDQKIFVYCQSGNRSQTASQILVDLGYTNVYEIGGILDWAGDIEYE